MTMINLDEEVPLSASTLLYLYTFAVVYRHPLAVVNGRYEKTTHNSEILSAFRDRCYRRVTFRSCTNKCSLYAV